MFSYTTIPDPNLWQVKWCNRPIGDIEFIPESGVWRVMSKGEPFDFGTRHDAATAVLLLDWAVG